MCGIAGLIRPEGAGREALRRMVDSIAHRGPAGDGLDTDGPVGFGHCRLAIIDPGASRQPMASADGRCWLTFNGEIYNFRELARDLAPQAPFRTRGDTEVLLRLLERDGEAAMKKLRGMFAFG